MKSARSGQPLNINRKFRMGVLGFHVIITKYGFWLPNEPREA